MRGIGPVEKNPAVGAIDPAKINTRADLIGQLSALFESTGQSLRGVADKAGLSPATVSGIVYGSTGVPRASTLNTFVEACGQEPGPWVAARGRVAMSERATQRRTPQLSSSPDLISINAVDDRHVRTLMLVDFALRQTGDHRRQILSLALQTARTISDNRACAHVLAQMSAHMEADQRRQALGEALIFIRALPKLEEREKALDEIGRYLDNDHIDKALDIAEDQGSFALRGMAKYLRDRPGENRRALRIKALRIASEVTQDEGRAHAFQHLIPDLDSDQLTELLGFAAEIDNGASQCGLLRKLAPRLDRDQRGQALTLSCSIESEGFRAEALRIIGPYLSPDQLPTALYAAAHITAEKESRRTTAALKALQTGAGSAD